VAPWRWMPSKIAGTRLRPKVLVACRQRFCTCDSRSTGRRPGCAFRVRRRHGASTRRSPRRRSPAARCNSRPCRRSRTRWSADRPAAPTGCGWRLDRPADDFNRRLLGRHVPHHSVAVPRPRRRPRRAVQHELHLPAPHLPQERQQLRCIRRFRRFAQIGNGGYDSLCPAFNLCRILRNRSGTRQLPDQADVPSSRFEPRFHDCFSIPHPASLGHTARWPERSARGQVTGTVASPASPARGAPGPPPTRD